MRCLTASGRWAAELLQCTATPPAGREQCNSYLGTVSSGGSCNALPPPLGAVGSATPAMQCFTAWGQLQWNFCHALLHFPGAVGIGTRAMHYVIAWGQWVVRLRICPGPPVGSEVTHAHEADVA